MDPSFPLDSTVHRSASMDAHKTEHLEPSQSRYSKLTDSNAAIQETAQNIEDLASDCLDFFFDVPESPSPASHQIEDLTEKPITSESDFGKTQEIASQSLLKKEKKPSIIEKNNFFVAPSEMKSNEDLHRFELMQEDDGEVSLIYAGKAPSIDSEEGCKKLHDQLGEKNPKHFYVKIPANESESPQFMALHKEYAERFAGKKIVLKADASASPEIKRMVAGLNERPITFAYMSSAALHDFQVELKHRILAFQAGSAEPHAKTSSQDIKNGRVEDSSSRPKDHFAKAKDGLLRIFVTSYKQQMRIQEEKAKKAREAEKDYQMDLKRRDRTREIEKKEHEQAAVNLELTSINEEHHTTSQKEALKIHSKSIKRLRRG